MWKHLTPCLLICAIYFHQNCLWDFSKCYKLRSFVSGYKTLGTSARNAINGSTALGGKLWQSECWWASPSDQYCLCGVHREGHRKDYHWLRNAFHNTTMGGTKLRYSPSWYTKAVKMIVSLGQEKEPSQGVRACSILKVWSMESSSVPGLLLLTWETLIPAWISDYIHYKVQDEITCQFPNFNGGAVEVWEWVSDFIPYFSGMCFLSMQGFKSIHISKRGPWR